MTIFKNRKEYDISCSGVNRFMKKIIPLLLCLLFFISAIPSPSFAARAPKPKVVLKMATVAPKGHALTKRMDTFNEEVKKATGNEVGFKIYWGGVQGDDSNVIRKIRLGQLHGGFFSGYSLGRIVPEVRVTELPYIFNDAKEVKYVRDNLAEIMTGYFDKKGYIVLGGFIDIGFMYLFSKQPIISLDTLRASKCWVPGEDALGQSFYRSMNIQPVPLSINDVMTSISTNLIDSAGMTPLGAIAFRWYTKFQYMSDYPVLNIVGANIVTKRVWKKISPENQKRVLSIASKYSEKQKKDLRIANAESYKLLRQAGVEIVNIDPQKRPEEIQFMLDAGVAAREAQVGNLYSRELMEKTLSLINEYRKVKNGSASLPSDQKL